ncbi:MAG: response regulator [Bryobacterales bacterium]|nr:response regulator [Bryobacterales bacterium]
MKRVLIVDDEYALRLMIQTALRPLALETVQACDGEEALAIAKAAPPDLVLLDWMMPKVTGLEVAAQLREDPETAKIPIIMLTARGQARDEEAARIAGVDKYLAKPFSPRSLIALVQEVFSQETHAREQPPVLEGTVLESSS